MNEYVFGSHVTRKILEQESLNNHLIGVSYGKCDNTAGGV